MTMQQLVNPTLIALSLALFGSQAQADELRVPAGMMLCRTLEQALSVSHAGCWLARGGQRVEIVAALPSASQLRLWSTDGSESVIAYASRNDADRLQQREAAK